MSIEIVIDAAFIEELNKIGGRRRKPFFSSVANPVLDAVGSAALITKGMHLLASGGAFGAKARRIAMGTAAGRVGSLGMGIGSTYLGGKGLAGIFRQI